MCCGLLLGAGFEYSTAQRVLDGGNARDLGVAAPDDHLSERVGVDSVLTTT